MNLHHSITSIFGHSRRVAGLAFALLLFGLALFTLRLPTQAEAAAYMNHINGINNPAGHATLLAPDEISCATGTSVMVGTHEVVFAGVRYDFPTVGESTWYYCVTSGNAPAISHLTINLNLTSEGGCQDVAGGVNGAGTWGPTEDDLNPNSGAPTIGNDATTDIIGLKFDQGFSGSETRNYYFTIDGNYAIEELTLATKAGTGIDEAPVPAPSAECDTRTAKLGDYVWQDTNEDGVQDADESGVADVLVNLYDSSNTVVYTTTTDLNGFYSFPVEPGDYTVEFVPPTGYTFTLADQGADDALDSDADANTGKTATVTLNHGDNNTTLDAGLIALASLGDKVFEDQDGDGIQDAGETGISGVTVNLWSDDNGDGTPDTQISSTSTDADGMYSFTDLDPRKDYVVEFELPSADYEFMAQDQGSDDALDSDADPTTGQTAVIDLAQGENNSTIDAGMWLKRASLGDKVFEDLNANGVQDVDEPGMPSITVKLWADTNNDGTPDMLIGDAITDANGMYSFTELNPSYTYYVEFIAPENRKWTTQDSGSDDTIDSDVNPSTGFTGPITLAPGENNSDTDAGLEPKRASLAGEVFEDLDGDGIQDAGEPPMPNVTVNLWTDDNGDGTPDTQIGTTTTDADGNYSFTELDPTLTYIVEFEPVTDREWTSQDVGSDDSIDSDVNPSSNYTAPIDLEPGEDNTTTDAGLLLERASLSGKVFEDLNENGLQDSGEPIVSGTTVKLWTDVNGDGWPDFEIGSTITDANGMYSFTDLDPNLTYIVQFIDPAQREWTAQDVGSDDTIDSDIDPMTSYTTPINLAPGEEHTTTDAGLLSERASLGDKVFEDLNENGIQDSGEPGLSNVAVNLWTDSDGDGQPETLVDSTTTDISGMYSFTDLNPNINYVIEFVAPLEREWTTQDQGSDDAQDSDADPTNGRTSTIDLAAGENNSDMDAGLLPVPVPTPTPSASPSPTATPSPTMTPSPTPEPPTPTPSASPTLSPTPHPTISCEGGTPVVIGGHTIIFAGVQYDYPVAGESTWYYCVESGSAPAISHVTYDLDLVAEGGCIDIVGDVNGVGTWDAGPENLSANDGLPQIGEDATTSIFGLKFDEGFEDGEMRQYYFTVDGNYAIGDLSVTTKAADDIQKGFVPGPSATCENSAVLGNFVWEDSNGNGVQDFGEQGMSDVTVNLYSSDGVQVDTTTTDENGYYSFTVTPGDYYVDFAAPGGYHFTTIDQGNNDATDSDANPVSGQTSVTTLEAGENDLSWDAGLLLDDSRPTISCEGTPVTVGNHQIIFAGVYYDYPATGQSTWFYCVESGSSPSLSHITYDLNLVAEGGCLDLVDEVNSVGTWGPTADYLNPEGGEPEIGNDPGTSIFGVKFDEGLEDGQMAQYYFTVDGNYAVGDMTVGTKAGQNIDTGVIPGPSATCENGAVISGTVWEDDNDNGLQDQAEPGLANVTVNLYDSNNVLVNSTTSDANGHYSFTVSPGDYHVEFVKPNGYSFTPANVGDDDTLDSDANTTTGHTTTITVQAGDNLTHWDAGLQSDDATSTVSCDGTPIMIGHHEVVFGGVRYDYPSAGQSTWYYCVNSGSHPSISHVTYDLDLVAENGCLDLVDGTNSVGTWGPSQDDLNAMAGLPVTGKDITTNIFGLKFDQGFEDGESRQYYFTVDGNYSVDEILLAAKAGRDLATGMVPGPSPTCNANATVGDMVWRDNNGNGIQDSGEVGLADVTVNLYDANGLVASTTTDSSGKYSFSVTPGDYYVEFVLPNGYIFSPADEGSDDTADSDANPITGQTIFTTLEAGENDTSWDAGLQQDLNSGAINCEGTPVAVGNDGIIFAGVRYDYPSAGQSTWYYCIESGSAPSISHVLFDLNLSGEGGCQNLAGGMEGVGTWGESANALHATAGQPEIGEDPTTSLFGLKFDQGFGDGEKRLYYFTLYNNYVVGEMNVATKAGPGFDTGTIPGPVSTCEIDGGEVCSESFSNTMWLDTNGNGVQDAGESGLADATVQLTGTGPDGELGTADDVQQATDTTDSNGSYEFFNVPPGLYRIDVDESTLTNGLALTTGNEPMIVRVQECNTGRAGQRRAVQEEVTGQGYAASVCERSVMYGAHDGGSFDSQFFMLDLATGESSPIGGQHNGLDAESIELNPETGELLVMSGGDSNRPGKLWTLDRDTGEITEIGSTGAIGTDEIVSAAFASDGTLWAFQQNVGLVTVNLSDGSTTVVWNFTGLGDGNWEGLAWDPSSSYLYGSEGTKMYRWNPADQSVEQVCGDDFLPSSTEALDFRFDGQLLGGWHNAADNALSIFEIDIASCEYQPITLNTPYNDVEALASEECVTPGSVEGTVVDGTGRANQGGNPVAGLELELKVDMNGDGTYNEDLTSYATTDENGHYQFVNLPRGKYTIAPVGSSNSNEFELAGEDLSQGVDITHTETTAPDTFDLYLPLVLR